MLKRLFCVILTLILLVSYVPVTALTAEAADYTVTEGAITVLKQLQPFQRNCNERGYIGYNTKCTHSGTHGLAGTNPNAHTINEKTADTYLRTALNDTVKAVNNFASSYGLTMSQNKFDALVIFSYLNGNAWMNGSAGFKGAVTKGFTGADFLDAICSWISSTDDDYVCMVVANMYLYGIYSSVAPSHFVRVKLEAGTYQSKQGTFPTYNNQAEIYKYYDLKSSTKINVVPTLKLDETLNATFLGYTYTDAAGKKHTRLANLTAEHDGKTLTAEWTSYHTATPLTFTMTVSGKYYLHTSAADSRMQNHYVTGKLEFDGDHIDADGFRWGHLAKAEKFYSYNATTKKYTLYKDRSFAGNEKWVKLGEYVGPTENSGVTMDLTVTVTNAYVNSRVNASISSAKNGVYYLGDKLRIIDAKQGGSFLWGQVAKSATDNTPVCWVALMYTNYDEVRSSGSTGESGTVVARAKITAQGYVNVRSDAGTDAPMVGSLTEGTFVDIYELKYVNGLRWGRTRLGWFCLSYADVSYLSADGGESSGTGFSAYTFSGTLLNATEIFTTAGGSVKIDQITNPGDYKQEEIPQAGDAVVVTDLTKVGTDIWGKIKWGWVKLGSGVDTDPYGFELNNTGVKLDSVKFYVASETATVREEPNTESKRLINLSKGTEINVIRMTVDKTTIWGYIEKEVAGQYTEGWVNLATKYFSRTNTPDLGDSGETMYATVTGAAEVNVRITGATSGKKLGVVKEGMTYKVLEGPTKNGWYKLDVDVDGDKKTDSWVYGGYLKIEKKTAGTSGTGSESTVGGKLQTGTGVVANTYSGVNVRAGAGTGYAMLGKILPGTEIEIRAVKMVGTTMWGKTIVNGREAWVCMDYVVMLDYKEFAGESGSTGTTGGSAGGNTVTGAVAAVYEGTVANHVAGDKFDDTYYGSGAEANLGTKYTVRGWDQETGGRLVVFSEPDIGSNVVRYLDPGDAVTLHELLTVEEVHSVTNSSTNNVDSNTTTTVKISTIWARVNDGYIKAPGDNLELNILDETTYTLVNYDKLYLYKNTSSFELSNVEDITETTEDTTITTKLAIKKGDQVSISNVEIHGTSIYGRVELIYALTEEGKIEKYYTGWVELTKMTRGAVTVQTAAPTTPTAPSTETGSSGETQKYLNSTGDTGTNTGFVPVAGSTAKYVGTVVNVVDAEVNPLKARSAPSTDAGVNKTYKNGDVVNIYETVLSGNMAWGRTDAGWVYLWYVRMRPNNGLAIDVNIIKSANTVIYKESTGTDGNGTYVQQAIVEILEYGETRVRTKLGWVNKTDLLHG